MSTQIILFVAYMLLSLTVAEIAVYKDMGGAKWLAYGLLFGPLALVAIMIKSSREKRNKIISNIYAVCPFCDRKMEQSNICSNCKKDTTYESNFNYRDSHDHAEKRERDWMI